MTRCAEARPTLVGTVKTHQVAQLVVVHLQHGDEKGVLRLLSATTGVREQRLQRAEVDAALLRGLLLSPDGVRLARARLRSANHPSSTPVSGPASEPG